MSQNPYEASSSPTPQSNQEKHGCLPPWRKADLPEPRPFSVVNAFKTIGPGAILLAAAIGGGEWMIGPRMAATNGTRILWIATAAIILQVIFNLEAVRYTLYTGEPIFTGIMRLKPGSKFWSTVYVVLALAQLATPALAAGAAVVVATAILGRPPGEQDFWIRYVTACVIIVVSVLLLFSGKSIEKTLERLSWFMIICIFAYLFFVNVFYIPFSTTRDTLIGFLVPGLLPSSVARDLSLLVVFAAVAGSGGIGNMVISNWFRDKGFGMAAHVGGIGSVLREDHQELATTGFTFPVNPENMRRWKTWWRYAELDQVALWGVGCFLGMFLNVNLMLAIAPEKAILDPFASGAIQAQFISDRLGSAFWIPTLLTAFWILYSTHLGNTDGLVRTISDILWVAYPKVQRITASRLYAMILVMLTVFALLSVGMGSVLSLFKVLGLVAAPIMALGALQILIVNSTLLPRELRPPIWRRIGLVLCSLAYGGLTLLSLYDLVT